MRKNDQHHRASVVVHVTKDRARPYLLGEVILGRFIFSTDLVHLTSSVFIVSDRHLALAD